GAGPAALILPECYALSDKTLEEIGAFLNAGRDKQVFWDVSPGLFDEHGKLRAGPDAFDAGAGVHCRAGNGAVVSTVGNLDQYAAERLSGHGSDLVEWMARRLTVHRRNFGIPSAACVRNERYGPAKGEGKLVAFERNISYHMSESLAQAGGNEALEKPIELDATLPSAAHVYDLRGPVYLGFTNRIHVALDPWRPSLFTVLKKKLPTESVIDALTH